MEISNHPTPLSGRSLSHEEKDRLPVADDEMRMPYIGRILRYERDREIDVAYVLNLAEDLYLSHHMFIHAPGLKPPSACLPILPLTFGMEMIAEVAACLAPGYGLIGFENVRASRWIELKDVDALALDISGRLVREDPQLLARYVEVIVFLQGEDTPALTGTACFGKRYLLGIHHRFDKLGDLSSFPLPPESLYRERHLFHGSLFHCISAINGVGNQGLTGEISVPSGEGLFRFFQRPQLLTAPIVLDGLLQLVTALAMGEEWRPLPMSIEKLETYCPTPAVGTRLPVCAQASRIGKKRLSADFEVQDGSGMVWARIRGCTFWMFDWGEKIIDYFRLPHKHLLCSEKKLPLMPRDAVCQTFGGQDLHDLALDWLARISLHLDEMATFLQRGKNPGYQRHWLFGRIAAKDAVRLWIARQTSSHLLHPAAFSIVKDSKGLPTVENPAGTSDVPHISIAHANDRAIAIAHRQRLGIDLEALEPKDAAFRETVTTPRERGLLKRFSPAQQDFWLTALWCAKEATGKAMGTGIEGKPRGIEAERIDEHGIIAVRHDPSGRRFIVSVKNEAAFVIALTIDGDLQ